LENFLSECGEFGQFLVEKSANFVQEKETLLRASPLAVV
jgi:hypothetical protein